MANAYINKTLVGNLVLDGLRRSWAPILNYTKDISGEYLQGTTAVSVAVGTNATGAEYTASSTSYTAEDMTVTAVTVTPTILYAKWVLNDLERVRNPTGIEGLVKHLTNGVANQAFGKINALVTSSNYSTASTIAAANFDADDLADLSVTLTATKQAQMDRVAVLSPAYHGNLLKDGEISAAYASGTTSVIIDNVIPRVRGFNVHQVFSIANNSQNLGSWVSDSQAIVVVARPCDIIQGGDVIGVETVVDEASGIPLTLVEAYKDGNYEIRAQMLFGCAKGTDTLVRITTA